MKTVREQITNGMTGALSRFYRGPLKSFIQTTGLNVYLRRIYWAVLLTIADPKTVQLGHAQAKFRVSTRQEYRRLENLMYEDDVIAALLNEIDSDDVVYDIGANIGTYSCLIANNFPTSPVFAFEPHPETADRLEENVTLNEGDVNVARYALSDTSGEKEFVPVDDELGAGEHALAAKSTSTAITVETIPGDELISEDSLPQPNVMKIDVEGAELKVIRGLREALASRECRLVYCEVHPEKLDAFGEDPGIVRRELAAAGFDVDRIHERGGEYFLRARR
jgi:FkbM family methyltransferase